MSKILCIYHGNCADGFGAAWVVRKWALQFNFEIEFYPGVYQQEPPWEKINEEVDVYLVDFSYKVPVMEKLVSMAQSVTIIDHHKSAIEDLQAAQIPELSLHLDSNHSGAMLAWIHFFPNEKPPKLLEHIEDRDLWKFKLEGTREIQANLFSYPYNFEVWDSLMDMDVTLLVMEGKAIERKHFKDIRENLNTGVRWMKIGGVEMPVINCPKEWGSDAANMLAENAINKCAAYYWDSTRGRNFGLRSVGAFDVSALAAKYGGGGHLNAAGFTCTPLQALKFEFSLGDPNNWSDLRTLFALYQD